MSESDEMLGSIGSFCVRKLFDYIKIHENCYIYNYNYNYQLSTLFSLTLV